MAYSISLRKKTLAALILVGGVMLAILIAIGESNEKESPFLSIQTGNKEKNTNLEHNTGPVSDSSAASRPDIYENLTEKIAKLYGDELIRLNELGGAKTGNPIAVPKENVLNEILISELDKKISFPAFDLGDIKTFSQNDASGVTDYLKAVVAGYQEYLGGQENLFAAVASAATNRETSELEAWIGKFSAYIDDLLAINVPQGLQNFHIEFLNFWLKNKTIAEIIIRSDEDPLKAAMAVEIFSEITDEENALLAGLEEQFKNLKLQ